MPERPRCSARPHAIEPGIRWGVLEGDIETSLDADQLQELGVAVALVSTSAGFGGECYLDAVMFGRRSRG